MKEISTDVKVSTQVNIKLAVAFLFMGFGLLAASSLGVRNDNETSRTRVKDHSDLRTKTTVLLRTEISPNNVPSFARTFIPNGKENQNHLGYDFMNSNIEYTCIDSDAKNVRNAGRGENLSHIYKKGQTYQYIDGALQVNNTKIDTCSSLSSVIEYSCSVGESQMIKEEITCPDNTFCYDGACVKPTDKQSTYKNGELTCVDFEDDPAESSSAAILVNYTNGESSWLEQTDSCAGPKSMYNFICTDNNSGYTLDFMYCPNGGTCKDGRCSTNSCNFDEEGAYVTGESGKKFHTNYCLPSGHINKFYCNEFDQVEEAVFGCPSGTFCDDVQHRCMPLSCYDSDGDDISQKGWVNHVGSKSKVKEVIYDECASDGDVLEKTCSLDNTHLQTTKKTCPKGTQCLSGACQKVYEEHTLALTCPTQAEIDQIESDFNLIFINQPEEYSCVEGDLSQTSSQLAFYNAMRLAKNLPNAKPLPWAHEFTNLYEWMKHINPAKVELEFKDGDIEALGLGGSWGINLPSNGWVNANWRSAFDNQKGGFAQILSFLLHEARHVQGGEGNMHGSFCNENYDDNLEQKGAYFVQYEYFKLLSEKTDYFTPLTISLFEEQVDYIYHNKFCDYINE